MNFYKKILLTFIAIALVAAGAFNCMFVAAAELSNSTSVPYSEESGFFLDNTTPDKVPGTVVPEVTMGVTVEKEESPDPTYNLMLEWGNMELTYIFTADASGTANGGAWSEESFDGTNNKITITNNSSQDVKGNMVYNNTVETRPDEASELIDTYDLHIGLATYDETTATPTPDSVLPTTRQFTLDDSSNTAANSATYYIYNEYDLYTQILESSGEMTAPTESIEQLKVGIITVEATILTS